MSDKKHIDRLFQEGFKDFEVAPSDAVWKNIEAQLNKKKKKRVIPIWWRYAGIAASLLLLVTIGGMLLNDSKTNPPSQVVETEDVNKNDTENSNNTTAVSNSNEKDVPLKEASKKTEEPLGNDKVKNETSIAETSNSKNEYQSQVDKDPKPNFSENENNEVIAKNEGAVQDQLNKNTNTNAIVSTNSNKGNTSTKGTLPNTAIDIPKATSNTVAQTKNELSQSDNQSIAQNKKEDKALTIEEAIEENKELLEKTKKTNRWAVAPNAAPVYFSSLGQGSSIDPQFNNNSKSGEVNMSYGISASYALNDKISIRSGINKVSLGYNTNDVIVYQTIGLGSQNPLQNVSEGARMNLASDNVSVASEANFSNVPIALNANSTTLNQAFGFIEIPLEVQYALSNKKLGVNVIGGFSSFFLNSNKIYSEAENGSRLFLGEANNLNKVSYSANFGLGFNYQISKRLDLNLEPMFKYQFNTFNNTSGNFTPFFIGVYSGFAIKF